jgi:anti-anti-sigma factor
MPRPGEIWLPSPVGVQITVQIERIEIGKDTIELRFAGIIIDDAQAAAEGNYLNSADYGRRILFNLRDVRLLNSLGIGLLLQINRRVRTDGGKFVIFNVPPNVRQVINFMKLDQVLSIAASEHEAHEMLI